MAQKDHLSATSLQESQAQSQALFNQLKDQLAYREEEFQAFQESTKVRKTISFSFLYIYGNH